MEKKQAIQKIINHVKEHPELHKTPDHLINTYTGAFTHPIKYCKECAKLVEEFDIDYIPELKRNNWGCYIEEKSAQK